MAAERAMRSESTREWRERWVKVAGLRIRVLDGGKGPAVVFLHGVGGWAENWRDVLPAVIRAGYRIIACDLPGFGRSDAPGKVRYFDSERSFYVAFVDGLLDALRLRKVTLVGHSMGGTIAMTYAASRPRRVRRLVLAAPGGFGDDVSARLRLLALPICQPLSRYIPAKLIVDFVAANFHRSSRAPGWLLAEARAYGPRSACEMARVLAQALPFGRQNPHLRKIWCDRIAEITCPTLIAWGRQDRTLPISHLERAREVLRHACVDVIEDAGHLLTVERSQEIVRTLVTFLWATEPARRRLAELPVEMLDDRGAQRRSASYPTFPVQRRSSGRGKAPRAMNLGRSSSPSTSA